MSDLLKKFKSVFIVEEPGAADNTSNTTQAPVEKSESAAPVQTATPAAGQVSNKFLEILMGALEKNNQEGFDYFEFRQALINLSKMPMDEATRFQSAFAMAQTMGVSAVKLTESAQFYLGVLQSEQSKFAEAHAQQRSKLIGNREEEIKSLEASIVQKTEQIKKLTQEIEEHRQRSAQVRKEIDDSTVKIETTKADFEATFNNVMHNIQADISKIQQHIK